MLSGKKVELRHVCEALFFSFFCACFAFFVPLLLEFPLSCCHEFDSTNRGVFYSHISNLLVGKQFSISLLPSGGFSMNDIGHDSFLTGS